jgi:hypothetical protein
LVALMVLQALPVTGPVLASVGAPFVTGWLAHLTLISLIVDALAGRLSLAVMLIPLIAYSTYYLAYWKQGVRVAQYSAELRRSNPGKLLDFNPDVHSLVMDQAGKFAASHQIPVVYAREPSYKPEEYLSFRLWSTEQLPQFLKDSRSTFQVFDVYLDDLMQPNLRELRVPERPSHQIVEATVFDDPGNGWRDWKIGEERTSVTLEGKTVGVFKSGFVFRFPKFPFLWIGCQFHGSPPQHKCDADFIGERVPIESGPDGVDRDRYDDPVSIMLGIKKLADEEILAFRGFAANADAAEPVVTVRPVLGEDEAFDALQAVINGENPIISWTTGPSIAGNPARLAPFAASMVKRFLALSQPDKIDAPGRREQAALLSTGIVALPQADFAAAAGQLSGVMRRGGAPEEFPALYVRLADADANMYSLYRDRFLAHDASRLERLLASLAICRIGQVDNELISAIRLRWMENDPSSTQDDNYKSALFISLLKLSQDDVKRTAAPTDSPVLKAWYDAVLAGRGKTEVGPNNCMPMEWPRAEYIPSGIAPGLRWSHEKWLPTVQK